ncbi:MAG: histidine--tRNA ligase [Bacteroidetes bacterium]|jgi:histidyl-tRNA synthetase|nr:MAG: histidine--tRNA ligase [Cryomorphaceae bacterium BACL29 MAG-121220-bin8]MDA0758423.1 histidine--tRNA ligase [Bacteroidota bacterium]MDA1019416.1 histidine--tRNA ligase [Bacteroidota bacterium]|tara:strand:- start:7365 stop:8723 length:1359 start_codon:yes stop_codon:yes gene_type:complete
MSKLPSNLKGTRDFLPSELSKRNYIIDNLKKNFQLFGFSQIETPALEKNATLLGKYGSESDRLIFKILNSGEKLKKADIESLQKNNLSSFSDSISEKGLRYDLTVPLARFVAQHQNDIIFPFKRFQIQNVWRADRPQHGRFQEFTQCDADVIGSNSIIQEIELIKLYDKIFTELGFNDLVFNVNHRLILKGLANYIGLENNLNDFISIIDKLDKVGIDLVIKEIKEINDNLSISELQMLLENQNISIEKLSTLFKDFTPAKKGLDDLSIILEFFSLEKSLNNKIRFDLTLARGLNYYTGTIIEVVSKANSRLGSLGGGGRYDDLTSLFNMKNTSGVGISFGLDRIYLLMDEKNLFPDYLENSFDIIIINFGIKYLKKMFPIIDMFRKQNKKVFVYPDEVKINKQFSYANQHNASFAVIMGENEFNNDEIVIKNMTDGSQLTYSLNNVNSISF